MSLTTIFARISTTAGLLLLPVLLAGCGVEPDTATPALTTIEPRLPTIESTEPRLSGEVAGASIQNSYLQATVEPCAPVKGSELDPCERRMDDWDDVRSPYRSSSVVRTPDPPSVEESLSRYYRDTFTLPHIIVRATVIPGTTRCVEQPNIIVGKFKDDSEILDMERISVS